MERVAQWLPDSIIENEAERQVINAALADQRDGTSYIADLSENGPPATKELLTRLSTQEAKALSSRDVAPADAAGDLIARAWIEHFKKQRDGLDLGKPDECRRRLSLAKTIKVLESARDWNARATVIYPEIERIYKADAATPDAQENSPK